MTKLTMDVIKRFAPDAKSISAAKSVADPRKWSSLGVDRDGTLWGEYNGSERYSLFVSSTAPSRESGCSCPSRKRPCKHVIGLLMLAAGGHPIAPARVPDEVRTAVEEAYYESSWE
jgi:uncharacterized Zn finger protein